MAFHLLLGMITTYRASKEIARIEIFFFMNQKVQIAKRRVLMKNKKRLLALAMTASMAATMMVGCGSKTAGNGSGKGSEAAFNGSAA